MRVLFVGFFDVSVVNMLSFAVSWIQMTVPTVTFACCHEPEGRPNRRGIMNSTKTARSVPGLAVISINLFTFY